MNLYYLIFLIFVFIYKIEPGKIRPNFDEIFGNGWASNENEEQLIKIENSKLEQIGGEIGNGSIDQMPNYENCIKNDQNAKTMQTIKIIQKFVTIKEKLREKGKYEQRTQNKIERKIGKLLGTNRDKIYKWKNELNLNKNKMKKSFYEDKKSEFIERFDEFKELYGQGKQKDFVKELGISAITFRKWKKELVPKYLKSQMKYSNEDKLKKIKQYLKIKEKNPKISDKIIAKDLKIGLATLKEWKKKFAAILEI